MSVAVRHRQWRSHDSSVDDRRRRVRRIVPDIRDAATRHSFPASQLAAGTKLCRPTTNEFQHVVALHDGDRGEDRAQGRQGGRDDVCGVRCLLDFVLRRQLRHGRLPVLPRRRAAVQVVSVARLHVVDRESHHLHDVQSRIQANIRSHSHLQHLPLTNSFMIQRKNSFSCKLEFSLSTIRK